MKRVLRDNGLSIVLFALFFVILLGQSLTGWRVYNDEQRQHQEPEVSWSQYLGSGDFLESTFENWESEFFQMAAFLILSAVLVQRGAAESKKPEEEKDEDDRKEEEVEVAAMAGRSVPRDAPGPVQRGGLALALYKRSLSLALLGLFAVSFLLHAIGGQKKFNEEALAHGASTVSVAQYLVTPTFWFESFQNWQSEFLSVGVLVVLSIFLRQSGSPESKPVAAPHAQTGT